MTEIWQHQSCALYGDEIAIPKMYHSNRVCQRCGEPGYCLVYASDRTDGLVANFTGDLITVQGHREPLDTRDVDAWPNPDEEREEAESIPLDSASEEIIDRIEEIVAEDDVDREAVKEIVNEQVEELIGEAVQEDPPENETMTPEEKEMFDLKARLAELEEEAEE